MRRCGVHGEKRSGVSLLVVRAEHPVGIVRGGTPPPHPTGPVSELGAASGSGLEITYIPACSAGDEQLICATGSAVAHPNGFGLPQVDLACSAVNLPQVRVSPSEEASARCPAKEKVGGEVHSPLPAGQEGNERDAAVDSGSGLANPPPSIVAARSLVTSPVSGRGEESGATPPASGVGIEIQPLKPTYSVEAVQAIQTPFPNNYTPEIKQVGFRAAEVREYIVEEAPASDASDNSKRSVAQVGDDNTSNNLDIDIATRSNSINKLVDTQTQIGNNMPQTEEAPNVVEVGIVASGNPGRRKSSVEASPASDVGASQTEIVRGVPQASLIFTLRQRMHQ